MLRDNVAQNIISELLNTELAHLLAQLKQQLNEELTSGWISDNDQFALQRLSDASKTAAIDILKQTDRLSESTKRLLSPQLIEGIYQAEGKRLNLLEKIGIDGDTINTLSATQKTVGDTINYAPIEQTLKSGNEAQRDVAAYIDEVVNFLK